MTIRHKIWPLRQPAGTASQRLAADNVGEEAWWQQMAQDGTPLVEACNAGIVKMSFFWRDPAGDENHSALRQVYVDINCVTDHHSPQPQSLQRLPGTDVWHWSTEIDEHWRGSYSLIPVTADRLPPAFSSDDDTRRKQQREWWISLFPLAIADPLNRSNAHLNSRGHALSAAHMPAAPDQSAWHALDSGQAIQPDSHQLQQFTWNSTLLGNQRRIWLYTTGSSSTPQERPLVILLDGQNWVSGQPLFSALCAETDSGHLPAACWLFIDVINGEWREKELPCNARFWQAVQEELLPLARSRAEFSELGDRTVVAGQSYGGLAAMYAGLHWPERFGRILSQSGSFWWPNFRLVTHFSESGEHEMGWLTGQVINGELPAGRLKIFQEAGDREGDMAWVNQQIRQALLPVGHDINFRIFSGGHDALCWRGGLLDGLRWLLADFNSPPFSGKNR
ncbi:enterochelin esterase [Erwinia sorbitola]|uniref:enterochelin esterase n=1 Tax=Erwinia sorbitola TaxID=2681984 RepID=UPI001E348E48|nr:enterochelin esterase [Erwinia sorbitola]